MSAVAPDPYRNPIFERRVLDVLRQNPGQIPGGDVAVDVDVPQTGYLTASWGGEVAVGESKINIVPRLGNTETTFTLDRVRARIETPPTAGTVTMLLKKSSGGGAATWTSIATLTIAALTYEATDVTTGLGSVSSSDILVVEITDPAVNANNYTVLLTGHTT